MSTMSAAQTPRAHLNRAPHVFPLQQKERIFDERNR
jgi:hypothetical protein